MTLDFEAMVLNPLPLYPNPKKKVTQSLVSFYVFATYL